MGRMGPIHYLDLEVPFGPAGRAAVGSLDQDLGGFAQELDSGIGSAGPGPGREGSGSGPS